MESTKTYTLIEIGTLMIKEAGFHEGTFAVNISIGMGVGPVPAGNTGLTVPGAMFGIHGLGLNSVEPGTPNSLDAAVVNPAPRARPEVVQDAPPRRRIKKAT